MTSDLPDPSGLALDELRSARQQLLSTDDAVSYARRIAQARFDLVAAEADRRRSSSGPARGHEDLRDVLSSQLTSGPARPPRAADDFSAHPLAVELDGICSTHGFGRLPALDGRELAALADAIAAFEARVSAQRRELFDRLDALSAELVQRYRDGVADVDSLHS